MTTDRDSFAAFLRERAAAASAYVEGDAAPVGGMAAATGAASFFPPRGGIVTGAGAVRETYERDAGSFQPGGESRFEILHQDADAGLGYWVGFQRATARLTGQEKPVEFNLRVTELFRREGDEWKLIHRHADPLADEPAEKPS